MTRPVAVETPRVSYTCSACCLPREIKVGFLFLTVNPAVLLRHATIASSKAISFGRCETEDAKVGVKFIYTRTHNRAPQEGIVAPNRL